ncbi:MULTISPECIES: DNA phosphorothioation-dependent restriction protein DptG [Pseudoalteromonas]|uniref:DNA phosphorothioation-dependent restriction protein DptG n=1 Tax=Pseudoalteromonas ulvae TaxID=107327 RepID=A0A244CNX0_PSEDV|nr:MULTISPECIES: DNA phosphorothioation-dependent restriction protein DptG [Pseudoalteromonas]MDP5213398.1 DNA phosphorothioation-dependent restriction protein DptG [Pseudoalteromonas tunicata]OUL56899.1 DNA phosphorothioation-dependent restriction protein DptG [Pseudoalteromonas ulvae]
MLKETLTPPGQNKVSSFLPITTKDEHYKFCWDTILGFFVSLMYDKAIVTESAESFKDLCEKRITEKVDEVELWTILEKMYFENDQLYKVSPELLIFKATKDEVHKNDKRLGAMFAGLLNGFSLVKSPESELNFLEKEIKDEFDNFYVTGKKADAKYKQLSTYLPFLTAYFQKDLAFLNEHPHYLLNNFNAMIRLYGFLYIAQTALNIKDWSNGEPKSKPCFFIVDNERASEERTQVKTFGYKQLHEYIHFLFPYLFMNEALQPDDNIRPLWQLYTELQEQSSDEQQSTLAKLNQFGREFVEQRVAAKRFNNEQTWQNQESIEDAISALLKVTYAQFDRKTGRLAQYNETPVKGMINHILNPFIQKRGKAGQVLTFNQDLVVLLTNLAIGTQDKLRFHELIKEFEARGVFFDKQSQQTLIDFYERMGNVERMSDSGDAVYVRKTV